jgi:hypothetical protein
MDHGAMKQSCMQELLQSVVQQFDIINAIMAVNGNFYGLAQQAAAHLLTWFYVGPPLSLAMDLDVSDRSSVFDNQSLIASTHTLDANDTTPRCFRAVPLPTARLKHP